MTISQDFTTAISDALPFLRRYARALTGEQTTGDTYAAVTLEAVLEDRSVVDEASSIKIGLFKVFHTLWNSSGAPVDDNETGLRAKAQAHLANLTPKTREALLLQHMAWDTMLIHGHVLWSETAWSHFGNRYKYVTLMRDPVARMISNFRMAQRNGVVTQDLGSYLSTPIARKHAQVYLRYLCGRNDIPQDEVPDALALAKSRLGQFALIGFLDQTDAFIRAYHDMFGVKLRLARLNAAKGDEPVLEASQRSEIEALCAPDLALFEAARDLV